MPLAAFRSTATLSLPRRLASAWRWPRVQWLRRPRQRQRLWQPRLPVRPAGWCRPSRHRSCHGQQHPRRLGRARHSPPLGTRVRTTDHISLIAAMRRQTYTRLCLPRSTEILQTTAGVCYPHHKVVLMDVMTFLSERPCDDTALIGRTASLTSRLHSSSATQRDRLVP
jgi:hypothetical protein